MQTIDQKIKALQDEVNLWTSLLHPHLDRLQQMDAGAYKDYILGTGYKEEDVSAEFALESLVATYGRLHDIALAGKNLWPHRKDEFEFNQFLLQFNIVGSIIEMVMKKSQTHEPPLWPVHLINKRIEGFDEISFDDQALGLEELFTMAHRLRRALAKSAVLDSPILAATDRMLGKKHWVNRMNETVNQLPYPSKKEFRNAVRRYLASEFIFPWLSEEYGPNVQQYKSLFMLAGMEEKAMLELDERFWDEVFGHIEIESNARGIIIGMLERIAEALREIGDYEEFVNQIVSNGGSWGEGSLLGSPGKINIIPSDEHNDQCREILVAFARGRRSPRYGLPAVMRQVREHLIRCGDSACQMGESTRIAIIITDLWDKEIFAESLGDLKAHRDSFPGKVIIGALVNKDLITPQAII